MRDEPGTSEELPEPEPPAEPSCSGEADAAPARASYRSAVPCAVCEEARRRLTLRRMRVVADAGAAVVLLSSPASASLVRSS